MGSCTCAALSGTWLLPAQNAGTGRMPVFWPHCTQPSSRASMQQHHLAGPGRNCREETLDLHKCAIIRSGRGARCCGLTEGYNGYLPVLLLARCMPRSLIVGARRACRSACRHANASEDTTNPKLGTIAAVLVCPGSGLTMRAMVGSAAPKIDDAEHALSIWRF